jgi:prolyl 4-hydroxylase
MEAFRRQLGQARCAWMDGFLSERACAAILEELAFAFWRPSTVILRQADGSLESRRSLTRVSETAAQEWFSRPLLARLGRIERRLAGLLGRAAERYEPWQATRYCPGGRFDFHLDGGYWRDDPAGDRETTVLLYLDAPRAGGATHFPDLGLKVAARPGRLLAWDNLLPDGASDPRMRHAGAPVRVGRKTILVTWIRQRAIRPGTAGGEHGGREEDHPRDQAALRRRDRSARVALGDHRHHPALPLRAR